MHPRRFVPAALAVAGTLLLTAAVAGATAPEADADRTLSPYFFIRGGDPAVDKLPLKATRADVQIAGVIARVKVTQTYANDGTKPIEAVYVFPGSTRAAVFGMKMRIGDRVVEAQIQKREAARQMYEQARQRGQSASLLEQQRPNVFQMNVANIMPGDTIEVELLYTEVLNQEDGVYELVYPAVVGPRYTEATPETAGPRDHFTQQPTLRQGEPAPYAWDIDVTLSAGVPVHNIVSPSHQLDTTIRGATAEVRLADDESGGNRDFVMRYTLRGDAISTGALLFPGDEESFFLMMMQPPKAVDDAAMPAREYVFIVDVSGSMHGFPLDVSKGLMRDLFDGLGPEDRFNVMMFSGGSRVLAEQSMPATRSNLNEALRVMGGVEGGGGTQILPALKRALAMPAAEGMSRSFIVITDGYVSVEGETFELIQKSLGEANLFAFGIGSSVNRHLVEGMARAGLGEPFVALDANDARLQARKFQRYIASPALTGIQVAFEGFDAYDVEPRAVPDLFAQRPVMVFGKYRGRAEGRIVVTGTSGAGQFRGTVDVAAADESAGNDALRYLWARHRIRRLADMNALRANDQRVEEVTQLGLKYNLLTAYTSFIAIDSAIRNEGGDSTTVNQPLPLPQGVSDRAVGASTAMRRSPGRPVSREIAMDPMGGGDMDTEEEPSVDQPAEPAPTLRVLRVTVTGALQAPAVQRVLRGLKARLQACLAAGTTLRLRLTIGAGGKVETVVPMGGGTLPQCVLRTLESAVFPAASSVSSAVVVLRLR